MTKAKNGFVKNLPYLCLVGVIALGLMTIVGTGGGGGGGGTSTTTTDGGGGNGEATSAVDGRVIDTAGNGVESVQIVGGGFTSSTGSGGSFHLAVEPGKDQIVTFSRDGYVTSTKIVDVYSGNTTYLSVTLMKEESPEQLNATNGGTVTGSRNASITAPPAAFVDTAGNPVTGEVDVSLTPYDPAIAEEASAYPGELRGLTLDGEIVPLKTFGVLDVTVRKNGEILQIKDGGTIDVQVPGPSRGEKPDTTQMWHFDKETGLWVESEEGLGKYDPDANTYSASIGHLSPLNCDNPLVPSCIYGLVEDADGNRVVGAQITAQSASEDDTRGIYSEMNTGPNGNYCMTVERSSEVLLTVTTQDGIVTERRITAGSTLSKDYPADCSGSNCLLIRTIIIGTEDTGQGTDEANCELDSYYNNPFWGSCASELGGFYACFAPSGPCTYEMIMPTALDPTFSYIVEFENGSRIEYNFDFLTGNMEGSHYGPNPFNELCGTVEFTEEGVKLTPLHSIGSFIIRVTDDGGIEIECPSGISFILDGEQMDALIDCDGQVNEDSGTACEPKPGTFNALCNFDFQCDSPLQCCGPLGQDNKCLTADYCALYEYSCISNADCVSYGHDFICCSLEGLFDMCMLPEFCR